jgi:serine-type D-Ala-D-Ala carboxypeptidase/endopeptidase (penicillin-binding protein 4)
MPYGANCRILISLVSLFLLRGQLTQADEKAPKTIEAIMNRVEYRSAKWGALVVDRETGDILFARNPDQLFLPASTAKLFSCAAMLMAFGSDHRFITTVHRNGEIGISGTLKGDLILRASGDPTFGSRNMPDDRLAFVDCDHT